MTITATTTNTLRTLDQVKRAARNGAAPHWFDASALRFFSSRISETVYPTEGGAYFVSSERFDWQSPRLFTVRHCTTAGEISTVGEFQGYASRNGAHTAAQRLANGQHTDGHRWIMYVSQNMPGNLSFDLHRVHSIAEARETFAAFCSAVGTDDCSASLYAYAPEDWASAEDFRTVGCPFDYPSMVIERGPRGGIVTANA
uniref:Uncharacterized protein n=1 Tax=Streptomyces sp. NBC_01393 TaxID=2903851 RepID=A0AAU3I9F0_9ACTN